MEVQKNRKHLRAKRRVEELKGFYIHLTVFIIVNIYIITASALGKMNNGESFSEAIFDFGTFATFIFWGLGLGFHARKIFSYNPFFNKEWEERQIRDFMDKDEQQKRWTNGF